MKWKESARLTKDQTQITPAMREEIAALAKRKFHGAGGPLASPSAEESEATDEQPAAPAFGGWLRNVECRAGQSITKALKTLARHQSVRADRGRRSRASEETL